MNIKEAQERCRNLNSTIKKMVEDFQAETGCVVEDINYQRRYLGTNLGGQSFYALEVDVKAVI